MSRSLWSTEGVLRQIARNAARAPYVEECCPNCGAAADVRLFDQSTFTTYKYVVVGLECSASCWVHDPEAYIAAVKRSVKP